MNYKLKRINKLCTCGSNLSVCEFSNVFVQDHGKIVIGNNCDILAVLSVMANGIISIGNCTTIRGNSLVGCTNSVSIGNYVIISNNVRIYDNNNHPTDSSIRKQMCESGFYGDQWSWNHSESAPVKIEDNVWVGERVTILKGVTIGVGSIIGCDSVVTKSIPPYCIAAGNPAKVVKYLK